MNYSEALKKAEQHLEPTQVIRTKQGTSGEPFEQFAMVYGELADVIDRLVPEQRVQVKGPWNARTTYSWITIAEGLWCDYPPA